MHPQGHRGGSQCHADRGVTARRKRPVERRAQIVDLAAVIAQPFGRGPRLPFDFGPLEQTAVIFGVAAREPLAFAALAQLFQSVGTRRVKQAVISHVAADVGRNQRFCREVCDRFENIGGADAVVGGNRSRCIDGEIALEHGNAPQNDLLGFRQQIVAPIHSRAQSLVARQRGAAAARQDGEAIVEPRGEPLDTEYVDACGRQFERERHPVEPATNLDDRSDIVAVQGETVRDRQGALVEQLDRGILQRPLGCEIIGARRQLQRREAVQPFALGPQRFPAGGQNGDTRPLL